MNKYATIFFGFIAIFIIAFLLVRSGGLDFSSVAADLSGQKQEVSVKKYTQEDKQKVLKSSLSDKFLGNEHAPVVMVEYASLSCPHCADFHAKVVEPLISSYIETGKVKLVFRDFPTSASGLEAAKIAHCAGKDRYFSFLKVFFQSQDNWAIAGSEEIKKIAAFGGIDAKAYDACMANKDLENQILKTTQEATEILGVDHTPTIFINGQEYEGKHKFEDVAKVINSLLKGE